MTEFVESGVKHHNHNQWILLIDKKSWITYIKRSITNVNMPEMNMLNRLQNVQFIRIKIIKHIRIKAVFELRTLVVINIACTTTMSPKMYV
jgi:hypothetical protein